MRKQRAACRVPLWWWTPKSFPSIQTCSAPGRLSTWVTPRSASWRSL